jgi:hypothetical protein
MPATQSGLLIGAKNVNSPWLARAACATRRQRTEAKASTRFGQGPPDGIYILSGLRVACRLNVAGRLEDAARPSACMSAIRCKMNSPRWALNCDMINALAGPASLTRSLFSTFAVRDHQVASAYSCTWAIACILNRVAQRHPTFLYRPVDVAPSRAVCRSHATAQLPTPCGRRCSCPTSSYR